MANRTPNESTFSVSGLPAAAGRADSLRLPHLEGRESRSIIQPTAWCTGSLVLLQT